MFIQSNNFSKKLVFFLFLFISLGFVLNNNFLQQHTGAIAPYANGVFPEAIPLTTAGIELVPAFPNIGFNVPISMAVHPNDNKIFIGQRDGHIFYFTDNENTSTKTSFIDLRNEVGVHHDGGFLNIVLHPNFGKANATGRNYAYTYYCTPSQTGAHDGPTPQACKEDALFDGAYLVLRRYEVTEGTLNADLSKTLDMIKIRMYNSTHRGGGMTFGDDGFLYLTIGDQAQHETAQDMSTSFDGGILRLDVDMDATKSHSPTYQMPKDFPRAPDEVSGNGYFIPNDNPFVGVPNVFEEYFALGLRNPYRLTADKTTGTMYIGDIGSTIHEEINVVSKGVNYGWPAWEGLVSRNVCINQLFPNTTHQPPLLAFPRSNANSIIGGYVYRGNNIPALQGKYICGDWGNGGEIWSVDVLTGDFTQISSTSGTSTPLVSFGEGKDGELYVLPGGSTTGIDPNYSETLYKLAVSDYAELPPATLSATGIFSNLSNLTTVPGFLPYEMYESFWSDNAEKQRWMMIPNDGSYNSASEQIKYDEKGEWEFPEGTVFVKHFELPVDECNPTITRRLETRVTVVGKDKQVYGVTYKWRADGSDADLLTTSLDETIPVTTHSGVIRNQNWHYPSPTECLTCHNSAVKGTLGPRTRYLNTDATDAVSGVACNQLVMLSELGIIPETITDTDADALPRNVGINDVSASLEKRARSYLDLNCGYCHRPGTGNRAIFNAVNSIPLNVSNLFSDNVIENLGINDTRIIAPGDTARSVAYLRAHSTNPSIMMPPLGKTIVDDKGTALLAAWIMSLDANVVNNQCDIQNVALSKPTQQSSTYIDNGTPAGSSRAVDGNTDGGWGGQSISHTLQDVNPWWEVDLQDIYYIESIKLWNRKYCCPDRLADFYVFSSETPFTSQNLNTTLNQPGVKSYFFPGQANEENLIDWIDFGRYVRIQLNATNLLHLAEVEIFGCVATPPAASAPCSNIAANKQTSQSSTLNNSSDFDASKAVDGNTNGFDENKSITHTNSENQPWWQLDLGASYDLGNIKLWNRDQADCGCYNRLTDFHVMSSETPFTSANLQTTLGQSGVNSIHHPGTVTGSVDFPWTHTARYIRVQLAGTNYLTLAEVEVFPECANVGNPMTFGIEHSCGDCTPGNACNDFDNCTTADTYDADCNCIGTFQDTDNDGICDADDNTDGNCILNAPCDDGDACTTGDAFYENCICIGTFIDSDNDGICDANDNTNGNCTLGATCNDGDACTFNEVYDANCNCTGGTLQDSDNDGICDANDSTNGNCTLGAACDDGDASTTNDVYDANCGCSGVPDSACNNVVNFEDFEAGWGIWNDGGSDAGRNTNSTYASSGTYWASIQDNTNSSVITTDNLNLSSYNQIKVNFHYYPVSMENGEDFWLQISSNGGSNYTTVQAWVRGVDFNNNTSNSASVTISGPFTATTKIRFRCDASGNADDVYLDDIEIIACNDAGNTCPTAGQSCDDGDACTAGETFDTNCNCNGGTFTDADGDGVCDANDICANGNDNADADNDGTPDACDTCPNDGNNACGSSPSYCTAGGTNANYEYIANVTFGSINNSTAANGGYGDFTNLSTTAVLGETISLSLTPGYAGTTYPENWVVWIDFNRDGDFEDTGEEVFTGTATGAVTGSISIPNTASTGATMMRVAMQWNTNSPPCGTFTYGEVEDYTVILSANAGGLASKTNIEEEQVGIEPDVLRIYPNPVYKFVNVDLLNLFENLDKENEAIVKIYSTDGKLVMQEAVSDRAVLKIETSNLSPNQYYLISIEVTDNKRFSSKFLKL